MTMMMMIVLLVYMVLYKKMGPNYVGEHFPGWKVTLGMFTCYAERRCKLS